MNIETLTFDDILFSHKVVLQFHQSEYDRLRDRLVAYNSIYVRLSMEELSTEGQTLYDAMQHITKMLEEKDSVIMTLSELIENLNENLYTRNHLTRN